jgi:hypothetical protein
MADNNIVDGVRLFEPIYTEEITMDQTLRHFAKIHRLTNQVAAFTTYKEGENFGSPTVPEDSDHFFWLEFTQTIRNLFDSNTGVPEELEFKAYVDGEPIAKMDDLVVGVVWDPSTKKILPRVDFGDMSRDMFYFDYSTWQWKVPLYEGGKVQVWNPMTRQYENYTFANTQE